MELFKSQMRLLFDPFFSLLKFGVLYKRAEFVWYLQ